MFMRTATISKGGQLSVPAEIRHRWGVARVLVEDRGDSFVVRPFPDDPIGALRGSLRGRRMTTERARAIVRREEESRERSRRSRR